MNNELFKDTRLLEALDYIDTDLIGEVAVKLKFDNTKALAKEPVMSWKTPLRHWRSIVALAACLILLSAGFPLANFISQAVSNFRAGAGSGTTEETTESDMTDDDILQKYSNYILTEEDLERLNAAWNGEFGHDLADSTDEAMRRDQYFGRHYYGKYGDAFVIMETTTVSQEKHYHVGDYVFCTWNVIFVCYDGKIYELHETNELNIFSETDLKYLYKYHTETFGAHNYKEND